MARSFSGRRLCEQRRACNLRREHLAVTLNRSTRSIERYESGHVCPSADIVAALADALDANLDDLYEEVSS